MVLIATLIVAVMVAVKDGRILRDAGLTGSCTSVAVHADQSGFWQACKPGRLDGRPDLSRQSCKAVAIRGNIEWWRCPAGIGSSRVS